MGFYALVVITLLCRSALADYYSVSLTGSMEPTLIGEDRVIVDKTSYGLRMPLTNYYLRHFDNPKHGDVVVFNSPEDGEVLVKRIAAIPGDTVMVKSGQLLINGEKVKLVYADGIIEILGDKPHPVRLMQHGYGGPDFGPFEVLENYYFVLGDNRGGSYDGRYFGFVERDLILGRGIAVFYRDGFTWRPL